MQRGRRKYIVVESDDESLGFDEKASVIRYLRDEVRAKVEDGRSLQAVMTACMDGSRQLVTRILTGSLLEVACLLGADPRTVVCLSSWRGRLMPSV